MKHFVRYSTSCLQWGGSLFRNLKLEDRLFSFDCDCLVYLQLLPCLKAHSSIRNLRKLRAVFESDKKTVTKIKLANSSARVKFILV